MIEAPTRINVLHVDDVVQNLIIQRRILASYGVAVRSSESNDEALNILSSACSFGLTLDAVITDLVRPVGQPDGISLIRGIRGMSDAMTVSGGVRLRHIPIIVLSGNAGGLGDMISQIDPSIKILSKPSAFEEIAKAIGDSVALHRLKLVQDLECIGVGIVWREGAYRLSKVYLMDEEALIETRYWTGSAKAFNSVYSRLALVADSWMFAASNLSTLEKMVNDPRTKEREFQEFFELYPEFLGGASDHYWAQPSLRGFNGNILRPDFVFQPAGLRASATRWQVFDLKRAAVGVMAGRFHPSLGSSVLRAVTQLRDYGEFFADQRNADYLAERFGGIVPRPKLTAVIGRRPNDSERFESLIGNVYGVHVTTYDHILEENRYRVERMRALRQIS